ncbi:unnamed protein product [Peniophora sp. CBMAI 1063]|nr:unnamed protein product [Peniophora sp. CBMAI 1063]
MAAPAPLGVLDLPPELISDISLYGQNDWISDVLNEHRATASVRRLQPLVVNQGDCRGVTAGVVQACVADAITQPPSPLHTLVHTCSYFRKALLPVKALGKLSNTLHHELAVRASGRYPPPPTLQRLGASFRYGSDILIAEKVCSCVLAGIRSFYPTLRVVKVSLPWDDTSQAERSSTANFFVDLHSQEHSLLEHFDLELFEDRQDTPGYIMVYRSPKIQVCKITNAAIFLYGPFLAYLSVTFPFAADTFFGPGFLNALNECCNLQFLTIDGGRCNLIDTALGDDFHDILPVAIHLQHLRYLRMLLPASTAAALLSRLALPPNIDAHLEPVSRWGDASLTSSSGDVIGFQAVLGEFADAESLWCFAAAALSPARTQEVFNPSELFAGATTWQDEHLVHAFPAVALDIRHDILNQPPTSESAGLPEVITFMTAACPEDLLPMFGDVARASYLAGRNPGSPRRSLSIRDSGAEPSARISAQQALPNATYALLQHLTITMVKGQPDTPFNGLGHIIILLFAPQSWYPTCGRGWRCCLEAFDEITELRLMAPDLDERQAQMEPTHLHGALTIRHLEALANAIQTPKTNWLAPKLRRIVLPASCPRDARALKRCLEHSSNPRARLATGAPFVEWIFGS